MAKDELDDDEVAALILARMLDEADPESVVDLPELPPLPEDEDDVLAVFIRSPKK